jgi:predicted nucleotidyltransferase
VFAGVDYGARMTDGRAWISALGPRLERQQRALDDLLDLCESHPDVVSLSVGCSLGRGAADELSDVDAAVGVAADPAADRGARVRSVEEALVERVGTDRVVDVLREGAAGAGSVVRRVFVQRADGVQLDLAVVPEPEVRRGDAAPDFVPLYRAAGARGNTVPAPSAYAVSGDQVRGWAFLGWRALLDADKHLRRGSGWEAHQRLEEARHRVWQLWATAIGASYPWHGLSQVLDHDPTAQPPGIGSTVAGLDLGDLRSAVLRCADVLDEVGAAAAQRVPTTLPGDLAAYARHVLSADERP